MKKWLVLERKTDKIILETDDCGAAYKKANEKAEWCVGLSERYVEDKNTPPPPKKIRKLGTE